MPNDLLGISYVKVIKENNYKIKPHCIKRTNMYHEKDIKNDITSATSIRNAINNNIDIKNTVPKYVYEYLKDKKINTKDKYFKFLKYKIMLEDDLDKYQTVDEGIGKKIKKK